MNSRVSRTSLWIVRLRKERILEIVVLVAIVPVLTWSLLPVESLSVV